MQIVSKETICMKCQSLFSAKNKKNISECRMLEFLTSMLSINTGLVGNSVNHQPVILLKLTVHYMQ